MSSSRLPGKSLANVGGEPMLSLLLKRLRGAQRVSRIVVATSTDASDDAVAAVAEELGVGVHRGPLEDVLTRFVGAAEGFDGIVVRLTGDCSLTDPAEVDNVIHLLETSPGAAYATNAIPRSAPDGLDVEAFRAALLREVDTAATDPADREHVTTLIRSLPERWPAVAFPANPDLGDLRWSVDEQADLDFIREVVERLGERRYDAGLEEIRRAVVAEPSLESAGGARRA